jgi:chemotaxis protein CheD
MIVVNVSDMRTSGDPADVLATYSLGSCIAVSAYDPIVRVGGLLHYQLPACDLDRERARTAPLMFADTGIAQLLQTLAAKGAEKRRLKIKIAGAAQMLGDSNLFNIGRRNHAAARKVLWQHGLFIDGEDCGGTVPRNLYLQIADGAVSMKMQGKCVAL